MFRSEAAADDIDRFLLGRFEVEGVPVDQNIQSMWSRLAPRSRTRAVWFVSQDAENRILSLFKKGSPLQSVKAQL